MTSKINIMKIIGDHTATLRYEHNQRASMPDFIFFYGLAVLLGAVLIYLNIIPTKDIVGVLITSFSVFAALLFNLLILVYDIVKKESEKQTLVGLKARFLKELYSNVSYAILVSVIAIVFLVALYMADGHTRTQYVLGFLMYSLSIHFVLTMLLILKRVHTLLSKEFDGSVR
jgi:hypothetical protein